ncbi:bZIP transcription factor 44-like [Olea europaea var. sylvestris]|uniref:BZIP transcription factor 44-like n=1 Tax=Olea europaea subsp. europaea TaxID=158383 RepID=A0A8S0RJ22_OLEEU|nr:bZIP transcription factor 44-like [Olea europaea var. sylvestris]CAA2979148.1 bZIP transcription factor 44-like [Olea europaea subsp. europaea]
MASSSGNSSGSRQIQNSGSGEDLQQLTDQRKRKKMQLNRESAKRSRLRKQKHLDDMMAKATALKNENNQILTNINVTNQHYMNVEAENSVLRAQMMELRQRLQSLNEILNYIKSNSATVAATTAAAPATNLMFQAEEFEGFSDGFLNNPWNLMYLNQQPIMASAQMCDY